MPIGTTPRKKNGITFRSGQPFTRRKDNADEQVIEVMRGPKSVRPIEVIYMGSVELPYVGVVSD